VAGTRGGQFSTRLMGLSSSKFYLNCCNGGAVACASHVAVYKQTDMQAAGRLIC
jgi:hypothetical protein